MSVVSGIMGTMAQNKGASEAGGAQRTGSLMNIKAWQDQMNRGDALWNPYRDLGQNALNAMYGKGTVAGAEDNTPLPKTYDEVFANAPRYADSLRGRTWDETMGAYDPSIAVERERTLGLRDIANRSAARGIRSANFVNKQADFNAQKEAELSERQRAANIQRYQARMGEGDANYANTRNEYGQQYQGGLSDYQLRHNANQQRFTNLMGLLNVGTGATSATNANNIAATQGITGGVTDYTNASANEALFRGQNMANMWGGIGKTMANGAAMFASGGTSAAASPGAGSMGLNGAGAPINNLVESSSSGYTWPGGWSFGGQ